VPGEQELEKQEQEGESLLDSDSVELSVAD
jgi:hypothetical protein